MNTAIKTTIIRVVNDVGLHVDNAGIDQIAEGVVDELGADALGYVIGKAANRQGFCYWRVAERIYRLLEGETK